jgi:DNA invertase Pin-like site-specific DNA recombinase
MTLREEYESGCTILCLAIRHKTHQRAIQDELKRQGTRMRPRSYPRDWKAENNDQILRLAERGHTKQEIAHAIDCSVQHVGRVLRKNGVFA